MSGLDVPRGYLACRHDRVIPFDWQLYAAGTFLSNARITEFDSGHSPHLAWPGEFVEAVDSMVTRI